MVEGAGSLGSTNTANLMKSGIGLTEIVRRQRGKLRVAQSTHLHLMRTFFPNRSLHVISIMVKEVGSPREAGGLVRRSCGTQICAFGTGSSGIAGHGILRGYPMPGGKATRARRAWTKRDSCGGYNTIVMAVAKRIVACGSC